MTAAPRGAAARDDAVQDRVAAAFGADGALAGAVGGFKPRPAQADLALAVLGAIGSGGTLVAEAGTGTGKTFAYLVPALLAGGKVLLSTGSKPLQDQLFRKDLPAVLRALGLNAATALLKGRANYVCLQRLARTEQEGLLASREDASYLRLIARFAGASASGDRAEVAGVPETASIWPLVTSTRDNCLGTECPHFNGCFVFRARREAQAADVVVVNHHLFLADLALRDDAIQDFLPAVDTVVLDEAHQLPAIATDFFGTTLSLAQANDLARDARALGLRKAADGARWAALADAVERAGRELRLTLAEAGVAPGRRLPLARVGRRDALAADFAALREDLAALQAAVEGNRGRDDELDLLGPRAQALAAQAGEWELATRTPADGADAADEDDGAWAGAPNGPAADQVPSASAAVATPTVRWIAASAHGAQFHTTPLSFAAAFARARAAQPQAWILTSATLTAGGRFDHFLAQMGLPEATTARWDSPFDFARQALLYVPQRLPPPSDPGFSEAVAERAWPVIAAAGGRAFVLCTTLRAVQRVADRLRQLMLRDQADLIVLEQGATPRRLLLDRFRAAGNAVLVGSMSFWEGIDIRGDALSVVAIDKLPFAPPDDPVVEARIAHLKRQGRNAFGEYQLPEAVMLLKQGAGRLIRDEHDRGVLVLLDERVTSKGYGKLVLESLPPFTRTRSEQVARAFFGAPPLAP